MVQQDGAGLASTGALNFCAEGLMKLRCSAREVEWIYKNQNFTSFSLIFLPPGIATIPNVNFNWNTFLQQSGKAWLPFWDFARSIPCHLPLGPCLNYLAGPLLFLFYNAEIFSNGGGVTSFLYAFTGCFLRRHS